jgi:SAM-dependent methyltransferase
VLEEWHVAAAEAFRDGVPADQTLDLPAAATGRSAEQNAGSSSPEARRVIAGLLEKVGGVVLNIPGLLDAPGSSQGGDKTARTVVAVDVDASSLRAGGTRDGGVIAVVAEVSALPFRAGVFDAVATLGALERVADDAAAVRELARVLKPGGVAALAGPNRGDALLGRARLNDRVRGLKRPARAYFHSSSQAREYTVREYERLLRPAFRVHALHAAGWSRGWKSTIASTLIRTPPLRRFGQAIVVEAKRR